MSILIRLKEETKSLHEATEVLLFGPKIMAGELTLPEYKQLLWTNLAYHAIVGAGVGQIP